MSYPTFQQYDEALQSPDLVLSDPDLKAGTVKKNGLGLPQALCGGFALTYTLSCGSKKYAVRCFHKKSNALELRYEAISKKLRSLSSDYFLDFEFQPRGIRINTEHFPIVKMAWGAGEELGVFIENNYTQQGAIKNLKRSFLSLSSYLLKTGIAHGDIQSGNILVGDSGSKLQLIDYDGMFVDEIINLGNSECGHKNFQHPGRSSQFDRFLDRFSLISVYLALQALESDKSLWEKSKPDGESILFKANDYASPASSALFSALFLKPQLSRTVKNFAAICESPYEKIPSLADFLRGKNIPQTVMFLSSTPQAAGAQTYISQYPVLDAKNYSHCHGYIGDRVELIGRVLAVKEGKTRYGKPYTFINFGDWREESLKINIWSEALAKMKTPPSKSWIGKWVSVIGLLDPPYTGQAGKSGNERSYTHLSITVTENNQLYIIDEKEAHYRLNPPEYSKATASSTRNSELIQDIKKSETGLSTSDAGKNLSINQHILHQMHVPAPGPSPSSSRRARRNPRQTPYSEKDNDDMKCLPWIIGAVVLLLLAYFSK